MTFKFVLTRNDLADLLGVPLRKLTHVLYVAKVESYYQTFEVPKQKGGTRKICAPTGDLKQIQEKLYNLLSEHQQVVMQLNHTKSNISHGFERGKGIITNAEVHRNKRFVINIDLENFFDSFHFGRVCGFFEKNMNFQLPYEVAIIIAQLSCFKGRLPQGAPTSPIITNYICQILDVRISKLSKKYHLDYTRYADDLSFSTNDKRFIDRWDSFYSELSKEIEKAGFKINEQKTSIRYRDSRQIVTGLITNKKLSVDRRYYRQVRAMANTLYRKGEYVSNGVISSLGQLEGMFSFIDQLDKYNHRRDVTSPHSVYYLNGRERQYQKFLFYRYFFVHENPLIVTEGKTDIKYIKAALKSLYNEYPQLIEKKSDGSFRFKVQFLKRTKRLRYFFGFGQDGADAMKNLYNFFADKNPKCPNYHDIFGRICNKQATNPVIFIFDNEIANKSKPISSFMAHSNVFPKNRDLLKDKLWIKVIEGANLYLVTNPLVREKTECEIEDLFDDSVRGHIIAGKTFSPKDNADSAVHYGKEIFANYILSEYKSISFNEFRPLLNSIVASINDYETADESPSLVSNC